MNLTEEEATKLVADCFRNESDVGIDLAVVIKDIYCELRGLLKEHAQFPKLWDTDARLIDWLKARGQY